jgi:FSR family fosmidomycin resistance protein-like MFS transporter
MKTNPEHRWAVLLMFMLAHAANDGFGWVIPPLLPAIREHFHLSYAEMGAFYTLFQVFGSFLQAPASYLVHLAPVSTILVGGMLWSSAGMFLASFSTSYAALVWISALSGIGRSTYHPLAVTMLSRIFGRDFLGRAMGFHLSASATGQVIAPFLVVLLLDTYGWRAPLMVWSSLGLAAGVSLFFFLKHQRVDFQTRGKTLNWPFFSRPLGIYVLALTVWGIVQSGVMTFLPLFLVDQRGFSTEKAAAVYALMSLSGAICRPFLGGLMDWMEKRKPVIIGGFIIAGLAILGLTSFEAPWVMYLTFVLMGIFVSGHSGLADTFMIELIPSHRREETLGFVYTFRMGVASTSPFIVGLLSEYVGMIQVFSVLGVISILSAFVLSLAEEKPWRERAA